MNLNCIIVVMSCVVKTFSSHNRGTLVATTHTEMIQEKPFHNFRPDFQFWMSIHSYL